MGRMSHLMNHGLQIRCFRWVMGKQYWPKVQWALSSFKAIGNEWTICIILIGCPVHFWKYWQIGSALFLEWGFTPLQRRETRSGRPIFFCELIAVWANAFGRSRRWATTFSKPTKRWKPSQECELPITVIKINNRSVLTMQSNTIHNPLYWIRNTMISMTSRKLDNVCIIMIDICI